MQKLYTNTRGILGRYRDQWVITTTKQGLTIVMNSAKESTTWKQSNLKSYIDKLNIKEVLVLCREPRNRLASGIAEQLSVHGLNPIDGLDEELRYHGDPQALAKYYRVKDKYHSWRANGVPQEDESILLDVIRLYFELLLDWELYFSSHLMPFYTGFSHLIKKLDLPYRTMRLKDFKFNLPDREMNRFRHTNRNITPYIHQVLDEQSKDSLVKKVLKMETLHYDQYFRSFLPDYSI